MNKNMSFFDRVKGYKYYYIDQHITFFLLFTRKYSNYITVISHVLRKRYPINAVLHNGSKLSFDHYYQVYNNLLNLSYSDEEDIVFLEGLHFHGGKKHGDNLSSVFIKQEYGNLPVKGQVVIDIGANIGDSSIYFARQGARKIFALEPDAEFYEFAKKNIQQNNYSDKIQVIWAACTSLSNLEKSEKSGSGKPLLLTLQDIINKYDLEPDILKVDCEGCEYDIILSTPESLLRRFSHMQIEYHYGYKNLKGKLENCGFRVSLTQPRFFKPRNENNAIGVSSDGNSLVAKQIGKVFVGWLFAERM